MCLDTVKIYVNVEVQNLSKIEKRTTAYQHQKLDSDGRLLETACTVEQVHSDSKVDNESTYTT